MTADRKKLYLIISSRLGASHSFKRMATKSFKAEGTGRPRQRMTGERVDHRILSSWLAGNPLWFRVSNVLDDRKIGRSARRVKQHKLFFVKFFCFFFLKKPFQQNLSHFLASAKSCSYLLRRFFWNGARVMPFSVLPARLPALRKLKGLFSRNKKTPPPEGDGVLSFRLLPKLPALSGLAWNIN